MATALSLAHGVIDERETEIIKKEILANGVVTKEEAEFLLDLRKHAKAAVPSFHRFVFEVFKHAILEDGYINPDEAKWLKLFVLIDGKVDVMERDFLLDLKASARKTCPEFDDLVARYAGA
jgi:hypothetical protein